MTEEERVVRERVKLTPPEMMIVGHDAYQMARDEGHSIATSEIAERMALVEAQLDKVLNDPQVLIEHPDQSLPGYTTTMNPRTPEGSGYFKGYQEAMRHMQGWVRRCQSEGIRT